MRKINHVFQGSPEEIKKSSGIKEERTSVANSQLGYIKEKEKNKTIVNEESNRVKATFENNHTKLTTTERVQVEIKDKEKNDNENTESKTTVTGRRSESKQIKYFLNSYKILLLLCY